MLGGYGPKKDEVNVLLSKSPEIEEIESKLNSERRMNVKLSDDNSSVQRNLRMVHKLLIDEREALSRILDAARKSIQEAKLKQEKAESDLLNCRFELSDATEKFASREQELLARIRELEAENTEVRRRAQMYAEKLLRHKGRLVLNMLRSGTVAALTQFFHVWKDYVQDVQTMRAAQELHEMTQGVGGRSSGIGEFEDDDTNFDLQPDISDFGIEAWDVKDIASSFGL